LPPKDFPYAYVSTLYRIRLSPALPASTDRMLRRRPNDLCLSVD